MVNPQIAFISKQTVFETAIQFTYLTTLPEIWLTRLLRFLVYAYSLVLEEIVAMFPISPHLRYDSGFPTTTETTITATRHIVSMMAVARKGKISSRYRIQVIIQYIIVTQACAPLAWFC